MLFFSGGGGEEEADSSESALHVDPLRRRMWFAFSLE